jgi:UDP-glucuronate 4-epimerase
MQKILVTGSSGFIGFHSSLRLLKEGYFVVGFDEENDYYDPTLKLLRRNILEKYPNFTFVKGSLENNNQLEQVFLDHAIDKVLHLAAQAGVRYSITHPQVYIQSNLV